MTDPEMKSLLSRTKVIACVGISTNPARPSYFVARYLSLKGYRVIGVNPGQAGKELFGEVICATLADIPKDAAVDMVDIFRRPDAVPQIYGDAITHLPNFQTIWMQIGVSHADIAQKARARGLTVIENKCPKIEYQRLFGELRMGGINTGIVSSRL